MSETVAVNSVHETADEQNSYLIQQMKKDQNNLSFWYPKVKDRGLRTPRTQVVPVPDDIVSAFQLDKPSDGRKVDRFIRQTVMPVIESLDGLPFLRNGTFAGCKDDFSVCCPADKSEKSILRSIRQLQYDSINLGYGGTTEIAVRERIPSPEHLTHVCNGMPLHSEFRVFYDFDIRKALYVVNYWDRKAHRDDPVRRRKADAAAFDYRWPGLEQEYIHNAQRVLNAVESAMSEVTGLAGTWAVDILRDQDDELWLIDMSEGWNSDLWDPYKASLCRFHDQLEAFITAWADEGQFARGWRQQAYDIMRLYGTSSYGLDCRGALLKAFQNSPWGELEMKDSGKDTLDLWDFIHTAAPESPMTRKLILRTKEYHDMLVDRSLSNEERKRVFPEYQRYFTSLFTMAMENFLSVLTAKP